MFEKKLNIAMIEKMQIERFWNKYKDNSELFSIFVNKLMKKENSNLLYFLFEVSTFFGTPIEIKDKNIVASFSLHNYLLSLNVEQDIKIFCTLLNKEL